MATNDGKARAPKEAEFIGMPKEVTERLANESDRGVILVLAAYLDEILGLILRAACVTDEDAESILAFHGPAGGFSLRIQLCKALALIHDDESRGLTAVRNIRNSAAHFHKDHGFDVLFNSESTIAHVANLAESQYLKLPSREPKHVRHAFIGSSRKLAVTLYSRLMPIQRPKPLMAISEMAQEVREEMKHADLGQILEALTEAAAGGKFERVSQLVHLLPIVINGEAGESEDDQSSEQTG